ncbi:hypothetical protein M3Y98_00827100 [Aphelenchoides besseyi]|nr:hypothetical protein M3Y98_00827100 [Aphelenchoides besseyi]KAI6195383.1 hypothetical protein M3Y96_01225400 [Aphelenchoides besseyi]
MPRASYFIDRQRLKILYYALIATNKFGDHLLLIPSKDGLYVKTCNLSLTACAALHLNIEFFSKIVDSYVPDSKFPYCKIKRANFVRVVRKAVAKSTLTSFEIQLDTTAEEFFIHEKFDDGMTKNIVIAQMDHYNALPKILERDDGLSRFNIGARHLKDAVIGLDPRTTEIGFHISRNQVLLFSNDLRASKSGHRSMNRLILNELHVVQPACFSYNVYHVKSLSHFAWQLKCDVDFYYHRVKYPLFCVVDMTGLLEMTFTLSTSNVSTSDKEEWFARLRPDLVIDIAVPLRPSQNHTVHVFNQSMHPRLNNAAKDNGQPASSHVSNLNVTQNPMLLITNSENGDVESMDQQERYEDPNEFREGSAINQVENEIMLAEQPDEFRAQSRHQERSLIFRDEDEEMSTEDRDNFQDQNRFQEASLIEQNEFDEPMEMENQNVFQEQSSSEEAAAIPSYEVEGSLQLGRQEEFPTQSQYQEPSPIVCNTDEQMSMEDREQFHVPSRYEEPSPIVQNEEMSMEHRDNFRARCQYQEPSPIVRNDYKPMEQNEEVREKTCSLRKDDSSQRSLLHDNSQFVGIPIGLDHPEVKATVNIQNQRWWIWAAGIEAFRE